MDNLEKLLELIGDLVNADGMTWNEKRRAVLDACSPDDRTSLEEFASWFELEGE